MNMNNSTDIEMADWDLMCPILLDWLEDPIIMPCCGSKNHIKVYFNTL